MIGNYVFSAYEYLIGQLNRKQKVTINGTFIENSIYM
jgi:hypothetical protein